ncbi:MAG: hypothetical protein ACI38Q_04345 [Candidatus Bruticola sp.]
MCSDQRSFLKKLVAGFLCLTTVSALFVCVGTSSLQAEEVRYPENLAWRLITEQELSLITQCHESFNEREHSAPPLFEPPSIPMSDLEVLADPAGESFYQAEIPTAWEVPPFAVIGPPSAQQRSKNGAQSTSDSSTQATASLQNSLSADQSLMPASFGEISADYSRDELPAPNLRPLKAQYLNRLDQPDSQLPVPFSLRRYHTKTKGFFHIALYGNTEGLLAQRMYNTLKAAAPNLRQLQGFGSKAFISFLPAPEPEKPFDLQTAKGEFTFSELEPEGGVQFDQLDPGLIKSQTAPSFKKIPVTPLPKNFDEQLRRQLAAAPYKNIRIDDSPASSQSLYAGVSSGTTDRSETKSDQSDSQTNSSNSAGDLFSDKSPSSSDEDDSEGLNPFAVKTNFSKDLEGMYVMEIYYPQQSLVCELAADTRFANLRSMLDIALLVQARMQRW